VPKRPACPQCGSFNLKPWLTRLKCGECNHAFFRDDAVQTEYVPRKRRDRTRKRISNTQEKINAKKLGCKRTPASGALPHRKADLDGGGQRVECKVTTNRQSFSLKLEELQKVSGQASVRDGEIPVFVVKFARRELEYEYAVLPIDWYAEMLEAWKEKNGYLDD
jgi:hypothetical protein